MPLPIFQGDESILGMLQTRWASLLNPLLDNPANKALILQGVKLKSGTNQVNHKLGRKIQGWKITRATAFYVAGVKTDYNIYDIQDGNSQAGVAANNTPELTLALLCDQGTTNADGTFLNPVIIDLEVF